MRMEEHFRDTLQRAVANEPPVIDAWDRFERRAHRGRSLRLGFSLAAGLAVIVAAVVIVPRLGSNRPGFVEPGPTQSPTHDPYAGWAEPFLNQEQHYSVRYPSGWQSKSYEHKREFLPAGLDSTLGAGAENSFGVSVEVIDRDILGNLPDGSRGIWADGREYLRSEEVIDNRVRQVVYVVDWTPSRCGIDPGDCPAGDAPVLYVLINGEDSPEYFGRYATDGELIARSIKRID